MYGQMNVSAQPQGNSCQIKITGSHHARRLRDKLNRIGATTTPIRNLDGTVYWVFDVAYSPRITHQQIQAVIRDIPGIKMLH